MRAARGARPWFADNANQGTVITTFHLRVRFQIFVGHANRNLYRRNTNTTRRSRCHDETPFARCAIGTSAPYAVMDFIQIAAPSAADGFAGFFGMLFSNLTQFGPLRWSA